MGWSERYEAHRQLVRNVPSIGRDSACDMNGIRRLAPAETMTPEQPRPR